MATTTPQKERQLLQQAEKTLLHPIHPHLISYCPSMDLVAVVTDEENLDVYRINGQRAFGLKRKSEDVCVDALQWEFNGKSIAVSWSDGSTDLISAETGKVTHKDVMLPDVEEGNGSMTKEAPARVKCIGWGLNFINVDAVKKRTGLMSKTNGTTSEKTDAFGNPTTEDWDVFKDDTTLEDFLQRQPDFQTLDIAPDLPDQLAMMDTEALLPKLPAIPLPPALPFMRVSQADSGAFGSQAEVDSKSIAFVPLTLNFIPTAGIYLHLIAAKSSQLQNLLLYITQTLQRVRAFFKHAQDLPRKFMMNISETLEEKELGDLVTNLFHIACTGNCNPTMKEWLVDELAEAGHKRWDTTVTSSFTTLLALLHENLIPALDRCSIVVSRLRGLAQFHDRDWIFSGPITDFSALLETLKNMRLLAHTAMLYATEEKRQFHSFSKWLRFTIDFQATEPESQSRVEMEQRDPGVDVSQVLAYIQYGLTKSDVALYLGPEAQLDPKSREKEAASYEDTKRAIALLKEGATFKEEALCLEHVLRHLATGVTGLLKQVSKWQQANIQMDSGLVLEDMGAEDEESNIVADMRMVSEKPSQETWSDTMSTYILFSSKSTPAHLHIHRLAHAHSISHLARDLHSHAISTLDFSTGDNSSTKILDAKFADDENLLVLLQLSPSDGDRKKHSKPTNVIVSLPYTPTTVSPMHKQHQQHQKEQLIYFTPISSPAAVPSCLLPQGKPVAHSSRQTIPVTPEDVEKYTRHVFEGRFTPLKLVVNGRKDRRVIVVLASDRKHYRILDMDYSVKKKRRKSKASADVEDDNDDSGSDQNGHQGYTSQHVDGDVEMGGA
ncbi:anaphase-promoting complex, cyclosome, subunit 4-domain-containing protein [Bipolaris maydis]|nr:anaphase-promoting complex, cyclosome, subunit 4-domain-containing protein [Bipolaris maydis]